MGVIWPVRKGSERDLKWRLSHGRRAGAAPRALAITWQRGAGTSLYNGGVCAKKQRPGHGQLDTWSGSVAMR